MRGALRYALELLMYREIPEPDIEGAKPRKGGVPIVLTASPAEMSHYNFDPFIAFICTFPHRLFNRTALERKWMRNDDYPDGSARFAPYGLRKVESLLVDAFGEKNVVVAHYNNLHRFIGPKTKLVGVSSMDPLGLAYVSTTYNSLVGFGGEAINAREFRRVVSHPSIRKHRPTLLVGGSGAWQIDEAKMADEYGIDVLVQGEGEADLVSIVRKLLDGEKMKRYTVMHKPDYDKVPLIRRAATYGTVEITRGCGRGCQFCSPTMRTKYSFPKERIMEEVAISVKGGARMIFAQSEDVFLYKCGPRFMPNVDAIVDLFRAVAGYPGVDMIHLAHASIAPVLADKRLLPELMPVLLEKTERRFRGKFEPFTSVEIGIESGSVRVMKRHMKGKALPFSIDRWPEIVAEGIGVMNDHSLYPLGTLMTNLPGETEDDVQDTLALIDDLKGMKVFLTPLLFIPLADCLLHEEKRSDLRQLKESQWEFLTSCWRHNVSVWWPEIRSKVSVATLSLYSLYYRWKHGAKARAILNLTPLRGGRGAGIVPSTCRQALCEPDARRLGRNGS